MLTVFVTFGIFCTFISAFSLRAAYNISDYHPTATHTSKCKISKNKKIHRCSAKWKKRSYLLFSHLQLSYFFNPILGLFMLIYDHDILYFWVAFWSSSNSTGYSGFYPF